MERGPGKIDLQSVANTRFIELLGERCFETNHQRDQQRQSTSKSGAAGCNEREHYRSEVDRTIRSSMIL